MQRVLNYLEEPLSFSTNFSFCAQNIGTYCSGPISTKEPHTFIFESSVGPIQIGIPAETIKASLNRGGSFLLFDFNRYGRSRSPDVHLAAQSVFERGKFWRGDSKFDFKRQFLFVGRVSHLLQLLHQEGFCQSCQQDDHRGKWKRFGQNQNCFQGIFSWS